MTALGSGFGKTVVLASADVALRERLRLILTGMRWNVCEAGGGAEAIAQLEESRAEAMLMDSWLPDLEVGEFTLRVRLMHPDADLLRLDGATVAGVTRSPRRHELLHALRELAEGSPAAASELAAAGAKVREDAPFYLPQSGPGAPESESEDEEERTIEQLARAAAASLLDPAAPYETAAAMSRSAAAQPQAGSDFSVMIPGMLGRSGGMLELARLIRLVAPKRTAVLIEGETGSGKEVVAQALHQLSARARQPFTVLNCAAIPEALLEAELFGHTRGAFTGAVQSRTGRIQAAHEGTLFLDEIGEMPVPLQAKMLRFLESGELQRVGDNDVVKVDVRVIAATHQHLEKRAAEGTFRLDLYHRLAVFPIEVPPLRERISDIAELAEAFLARLGEESPRKQVTFDAMQKLEAHSWPGNVRELAHVLERATILADGRPQITVGDVLFGVRRTALPSA